MDTDVEPASPRVLGLGVGLFLLVLTWSLTILGVLLCSRLSSASVSVMVTGATLLTVVLVSIPREPHPLSTANQEEADPKVDIADFIIYDKTFVPKIVLILFFGVTVLAVGSYTLAKIMKRQIYAEVLVKKKCS